MTCGWSVELGSGLMRRVRVEHVGPASMLMTSLLDRASRTPGSLRTASAMKGLQPRIIMSDSCIVWTVWLETILISCSCSGAIFVWRRAAEAAVFVHAMKWVIGFGVVSVLVLENALFRRPFRTAPPMLPWWVC